MFSYIIFNSILFFFIAYLFVLVYKLIFRKGIQNLHRSDLLINSGGTCQTKNNVVVPAKWFLLRKFKRNSEEKFNCKKDPVGKRPRFAKEFIEISSVRYKPTKTYTKCCPDKKPVYERSKCQMPYPAESTICCCPNDN